MQRIINFISLCFIAIISGSLSYFAHAETNTLLHVTVSEDAQAYETDLRALAGASLSSIKQFELSDATVNAEDGVSIDQTVIFSTAGELGLTNAAWVKLDTPKKDKAILTVEIYASESGKLIFQRETEHKFETMTALLARLQYDLPLALKRQFKQLGEVIQIDEDRVFFDLGKSSNIETGQIYRVFREGEEIKDSSGASFGYVDLQSGIIEVSETNTVYSVAEIILGRISIKPGDYVEVVENQDTNVKGKVLSKLDDKVAIDLGRKSGVTKGSQFAVFKNMRAINDEDSFRERLGTIRITKVHDDYSKGEIARSNSYSLAKALIQEGDAIEEVKSKRKNQWSIGQMSTNILGDPGSIYFAGVQRDSLSNGNLMYRMRAGFGDELLVSAGIASSLGHSESFYYGLDGVWAGGIGTQLFIGVDIPTPLSEVADFNIETGYFVGGNEEIDGVNISFQVRLR